MLYSLLYAAGERILKRHNPCKVVNGKCLDGDFCCSGCRHLSSEGCTVKCLQCKLWLCWKARKANPEVSNKLRALDIIARRNDISFMRTSKKRSLRIAETYAIREMERRLRNDQVRLAERKSSNLVPQETCRKDAGGS